MVRRSAGTCRGLMAHSSSIRSQRARRTLRNKGSPAGEFEGRRQKARKSCVPRIASPARFIAARSSGPVTDQAQVLAPGGRKAGVKVVAHGLGAKDLHATTQLLVQRVRETIPLEDAHFRRSWQVNVDDLVKGVNARIGTTGADDDRLFVQTECRGQRRAQQSDNGVVLRLIREPAESLAVIGQVEAPALRGARWIRRTQCAPSARCRPDAVQASRCACSHRDDPCSAVQSR